MHRRQLLAEPMPPTDPVNIHALPQVAIPLPIEDSLYGLAPGEAQRLRVFRP